MSEAGRRHMQSDELVVLYQPEIDMRSGGVVAIEALARWDHPELGRLGPEALLAAADNFGIITELGDWIVERALNDFTTWGLKELVLRINMSPDQLSMPGAVDRLRAALDKHEVEPGQLCVEVTETPAGLEPPALVEAVRRLGELGIRSAIDDLAAGHSTLARLRVLPVDTVKLDRTLVTGIDHDVRAQSIVRAVTRLAAELGLDLVAEGVENAAEANALLELGCYRAQGHYLGRPLDAEATAALLRA